MNQNTCAQIANSLIYKHNVTGVTMRHWCNTVDCNTSDRDTSDIHALYITAKFIHFISTHIDDLMNQNTCAQIANSVIYKHNVTGVTNASLV